MPRNRKPAAKARAARAAARPPPSKPASAPPPGPRSRGSRRLRSKRSPGPDLSLSPLHPGLIPSLVHSGQAFPISGLSEHEITVGTTARWGAIFTNCGNAGTIGVAFSWTKAGGATPATVHKIFTLPLLAQSDDAGGPTSARAMKCGIDLVTNTQLLSRGGAVYVLNSSQRFLLGAQPSLMTATQWNDFYDSVVAHPHRQKYDVSDFASPRHFYSHVVDDPRYNDYDEFRGTLTFDQFLAHLSIYPGGTVSDRPMSSIVVLFDTAASNQILGFTSRASFYTRWPLNSVPGQSQVDVPTAPASVLNGLHQAALNHARTAALTAARNVAGRVPAVAMRALINRFGGPALALRN